MHNFERSPTDTSAIMRTVFVFAFLLNMLSGSAQKTFSEGTISFDMISSVDGKSYDTLASYVQMVKGIHYRSDLLSSIGRTTTIFDLREGSGAIVRDFGAQKMITRLNRDNWREIHKKFSGLDYQIKTDTVNLLGYTCNVANAITNEGDTFEVLFTKGLVPDHPEIFSQFGNLPGLILGFSAKSKESTITYKAKSLSFDPVQIQKFDIPTTGYRIIEFEESKRK